jgi:hypothetical protein
MRRNEELKHNEGRNMKNNQNTNEEITSQKSNAPRERPEQWWARLGPVQQAFAHEIARLIDETTETKRIEIRRERGEIRARFVHILKQPENGCVSAIMLPEVPAGWN